MLGGVRAGPVGDRSEDFTMQFEPGWCIPTIVWGCRVLFHTRLDERHARWHGTGELPYGLVIADIPGGGVFLFECEEDWMPDLDSWHSSVKEARWRAAFLYAGVDATWERAPA